MYEPNVCVPKYSDLININKNSLFNDVLDQTKENIKIDIQNKKNTAFYNSKSRLLYVV